MCVCVCVCVCACACACVCVFASVVANVREYVRLNYREHDCACVLLNGISCASMYNNSSLCK